MEWNTHTHTHAHKHTYTHTHVRTHTQTHYQQQVFPQTNADLFQITHVSHEKGCFSTYFFSWDLLKGFKIFRNCPKNLSALVWRTKNVQILFENPVASYLWVICNKYWKRSKRRGWHRNYSIMEIVLKLELRLYAMLLKTRLHQMAAGAKFALVLHYTLRH